MLNFSRCPETYLLTVILKVPENFQKNVYFGVYFGKKTLESNMFFLQIFKKHENVWSSECKTAKHGRSSGCVLEKSKGVLRNFSYKFCKIHRETPVPESLF